MKDYLHHAREMFMPNFAELGTSGLLSVSFAGIMSEAVHAFFVILSAVVGGVLLHLTRYYMQKWKPLKKEKHLD